MENNNQAMRSFDGYAGKELIVNLTKKIISARYIRKEEMYRYRFDGQLYLYTLYNELNIETGPPGTDSAIMLAPLPSRDADSETAICYRSTDTGALRGIKCKSPFALNMNRAGFNFVTIYGKSSAPVYLKISSGAGSLTNAAHFQRSEYTLIHLLLSEEEVSSVLKEKNLLGIAVQKADTNVRLAV